MVFVFMAAFLHVHFFIDGVRQLSLKRRTFLIMGKERRESFSPNDLDISLFTFVKELPRTTSFTKHVW